MGIINTVTGWKWKLSLAVAGTSFLVVSGLLARSYIENRNLTDANAKLVASIEDPKTGFRAKLTQERTNRANLEASVERQNAAIEKQAAESTARLAEVTAKLATAQKATRRAEAQVAVLLANPPKGNTAAERMADVDARVLETLQ